MKKSFLLVLFLFLTQPLLWADDPTNRNNPAYDQAKQDYKAYLEQLKSLSKQYQTVVGEIKNVLKEEGVPTVDENTGAITMQKFDDVSPSLTATNATFGDVDITEGEKNITVKIDLPGVRRDKLKISIQDNKFLKIAGERETEKTPAQNNNFVYQKVERQHGAFERRIELPSAVQDSGTEAKYENGVLTVKVLKAPEAKKEIAVSLK